MIGMTRNKNKIGKTLWLEDSEGRGAEAMEVDTYKDGTFCVRSYNDSEDEVFETSILFTQKQAKELIKKLREVVRLPLRVKTRSSRRVS